MSVSVWCLLWYLLLFSDWRYRLELAKSEGRQKAEYLLFLCLTLSKCRVISEGESEGETIYCTRATDGCWKATIWEVTECCTIFACFPRSSIHLFLIVCSRRFVCACVRVCVCRQRMEKRRTLWRAQPLWSWSLWTIPILKTRSTTLPVRSRFLQTYTKDVSIQE